FSLGTCSGFGRVLVLRCATAIDGDEVAELYEDEGGPPRCYDRATIDEAATGESIVATACRERDRRRLHLPPKRDRHVPHALDVLGIDMPDGHRPFVGP